MSENQEKKQNEKQVVSLRFVQNVEKQFTAEMGSSLQFTEYEKTLAQHLFLKVDQALKDFEDKRLSSKQKKTPYSWDNINMSKLALDAVHRIALGLDALLPNHIHPVPYFNGKTQKYDLDLRVGYEGKDYYRREMAVDKPVDVIYELVHETDTFIPRKKSFKNDVEYYEFEINNPFERGKIIGGFGYIMHEDPKKNKLIIVTNDDFDKSRKYAQSDTFWSKHPEKMKYKVLVHRTIERLQVDPKKINTKSFAYVEGQEDEERIKREIEENANTEIIDVDEYTEEPIVEETPENDKKDNNPKEKDDSKKSEQLSIETPGF